jgi:hypothetical protein
MIVGESQRTSRDEIAVEVIDIYQRETAILAAPKSRSVPVQAGVSPERNTPKLCIPNTL